MSRLFTDVGAPELVAALLVVVLNAYVLMGGADLGSGVWDLLAAGPRRAAQRHLIAAAIGPIWEANHVWLIIVVVMLFTAFPPAFATISTVLHIPLSLMLVGIVLRGSAFVFRSYGGQRTASTLGWGRTFAVASVVTPILLGTVIGALAAGAIGVAAVRIGAASFTDVFVAPWLAPFPLTIGLLALMLFAQLAATYLTLATDEVPLREDFRRRAIGAGSAAMVLAVVAAAIRPGPPGVAATAMFSGVLAWAWVAVTAAVAGTGIGALWRRRFAMARLAVCAEVSLIVWGWAAAQYPFLVPSTITIRASAAPASTLNELVLALAVGAALLVPSLAYLLKTFAAHGTLNHGPDAE